MYCLSKFPHFICHNIQFIFQRLFNVSHQIETKTSGLLNEICWNLLNPPQSFKVAIEELHKTQQNFSYVLADLQLWNNYIIYTQSGCANYPLVKEAWDSLSNMYKSTQHKAKT